MALVIKNGTIVTEKGVLLGGLKIEGETITALGGEISATAGDEVFDARGKVVMPGVIDAHVHYKMPNAYGLTADNFETGTTAAACGGVTTIIDYVDPVKGQNLLEALKLRQAEANGHSYLDYNLHMAIPGWYEFKGEELRELINHGVSSLKVYTTYGETQLSYEKIRQLLKLAKEAGLLVTFHAEDNDTVMALKEEFLQKGMSAPSYHGASRPPEAEIKAIEKLIGIGKDVGAPVYIVHVSTGQGAKIMKEAQDKGLPVYGETCPHYLILTDECYQRPEPQRYIMTPPLRKKEDNQLLWEALQNGTLQCVTTDHCSYTVEQKLKGKSCFTTPGGIPGSETLLPLIFSEGVQKGRLTLEQLATLLATNPAKMFGLYPKKGVLAVGSDADITIVDPEKKVVLSGAKLHSACGYTPFEGIEVHGYPVLTILRGKVLYQDGEFRAEKPEGQFVRAHVSNFF